MIGWVRILYPKGVRERYAKRVRYSTLDLSADKFMGYMFMGSIALVILSALILNSLAAMKSTELIVYSIGIFIFGHILFLVWLILSADSKSNFVDTVLPDVLRMISANLRSGLTVDKALVQAGRDEFGPLNEAIDKAGKRIATGDSEEKAFWGMLERIDSKNLERAIDLIVQGLRSGGKLAEILSRTSDVFKDQRILNSEMRSGVLMYAIFIFFVLAFGAPALFGISDYLVGLMFGELLEGVQGSTIDLPSDARLQDTPIEGLISQKRIDPDFMSSYFLMAMIVSASTGSIVLGEILHGKTRAGIKFIPLLIVLSTLVFFAVKWLLALTLGQSLLR